MGNQNKSLQNDPFGPDLEENLHIENELLKLMLQAERGAIFTAGTEGIPKEVENAFLKNIQLYEETCEHAKATTVYELIGKPSFRKAIEIAPGELQVALDNMFALMNEKNIVLYVEGQYPPAVIYEFITKEFFLQEVMQGFVPGFMQCFIYEEFHPNHMLSIERTANDFIGHWFRKEFNEYSLELASQFITGENRQLTRAEMLIKLSDCLASYQSFSQPSITHRTANFEWTEEENLGLGFTEGIISYEAMLENGETITIAGPY